MSAIATAVIGSAVIGGVLSNQAANSAASGARDAANSANALSSSQFNQTRTDMAPWREAGGSAIGQLSYLLGLPGYEHGGASTAQPVATRSMEQILASLGTGGSFFDGVKNKIKAQQLYNDPANWTTPGGSTTTFNTQLGDFGSLSRDFGIADFKEDPGADYRMRMGEQALERSASAGGRLLGGGTLKALTRYGQDFGSQEYGRAFDRFNTNRNTRFNQLAAIAGIGQTANGQLGQLGQLNATTQGNNLMGAATVGGNAAMAGAAGWGTALNNGMNNWLTYKGYKG